MKKIRFKKIFKKPFVYNRLVLFLSSTLIILIAILIFPSFSELESFRKENNEDKPLTTQKEFFSPNLTAESAIVYDVDKENILFEYKPNDQVPLASITKLMTAILANEYLDSEELITITANDLAGGSNAGLIISDTWQVKDLIDYTLVTSSNGGASALARQVEEKTGEEFVSLMNEKAEELKLYNTYFINETGLDVGESYGGSYGSAYDIAILMSHIVKTNPRIISATSKNNISFTSNSGKVYNAVNTNYIVEDIPGLIGSKTGFTYNAGGNLTIAFDAGLNNPITIVVLGSTRSSRFEDVEELVKSTINYFAQ